MHMCLLGAYSVVGSVLGCVFWRMYVHISAGSIQEWNCLEMMGLRELPKKVGGSSSSRGRVCAQACAKRPRDMGEC